MGTIGIRCARNHNSLWFHVDFSFATDFLHPDFRIDGRDRAINELLGHTYPWEELTEVGNAITEQVLAIGKRKIVLLSARPTYFSVEVTKERHWPSVLPQIVQIIRRESNDPRATVVVHPNKHDARIEQWHAPLLERLFG